MLRTSGWWFGMMLAVGCAASSTDGRVNGLPVPVDPVAGAGPVELVADGFTYLEGPVWNAAEQVLYFCDQKDSKVYRLRPPREVSVLVKDAAHAGGLFALTNGTFALAQSQPGQVSVMSATGAITVVARQTKAGPLDHPNDIVARRDGTLYVTEPFVRQVIRVAPDGQADVVWQGDEGTKPNGIILSPDERVLYVSDTLQNLVRAFDVAADGNISGERIFAKDLGMDRVSTWVTDGMTVDVDGNVYVASYARPESDTPGEIAVFAANGARWGRIVVPRGPTNCAFGGKGNRTLWITAQGALFRAQMPLSAPRP